MPSPHLHVYLGAKLKDAWQDHCDLTGEKPGAALRRLLEERLRQAVAEGETAQGQGPGPALRGSERGPRTRLELRLTETERAKVQELADKEGCSLQAWVVNLVRARFALQPQVGEREKQLLDESNYQLLSIGRNLNQIAKRLNEGSPENVTVKEIRELRDQIDAHTKVVGQVLLASVERWTRGPRGRGGGVAEQGDEGEES